MIKRSGILRALVIILSVLIFPITAYADMGPKDSLTVYVDNPPSENYYLDLLTQNSKSYNNFYEEGEREALDPQMLDLLYSYKDDGWMPALTEGTGVPMWGDLIGELKDDKMVHKFGYVGLPDTYRIIIVTQSGKVSVSDTYTRKALQSSITFDYETGEAVIPNIFASYLVQFVTTCIPTLIIEALLLLLFGFKFKENYKLFFSVNISTQLFLTVILGTTLIKSGTITAYLAQSPVEIIILIAETAIYARFLRGYSQKRRRAYGIIANISSWVIGFFLLSYQYNFLVSLM